jgi:hypothetical protein
MSNQYSTLNIGTGGTWGQGTTWSLPTLQGQDFSDLRNILNAQTSGAVKITTPQMQANTTSFDKILSTFLSAFALHKNAPYVPTTTVPNQYGGGGLDAQTLQILAQQQALGSGSTGATFGATVEQFVTQNTGLIAVGVIAYVLFKSGRK